MRERSTKGELAECKRDSAIREFEARLGRAQTRLSGAFFKGIRKGMKRHHLTEADVAWTLGKRRAYVSRALAAGDDISIRRMVELAHAVGLRLVIELAEE